MSCLAEEGTCPQPVPEGSPLALCERHLAVAADWAQRHDGVTDVLPDACRLCGSRVGVRYPSGWICAVCEWSVGQTVDGELPPARVDVVYYLRNGDRVKIGTTANPRQRFAAIWHEEVLAFERGDAPSSSGGTRSSPPTASPAPSGSRCRQSSRSTSPPSPRVWTIRGGSTRAGAARRWPCAASA